MTGEDRGRLRATFDQAAELYDRARPRYPAALFDDLAGLTGIGPGSRVLEIGPGTGQATVTLAERGCRVVAVELGADLAAVGGLTRLPSYLQRSLIFPYAEGLAFVCGLYLDGGWTSVNQAYADPPSTTAQILFPERYESQEEAVDPRNSASPGAGWTNDEVRALGAADLLFLFEAPGDRADRALEDPLKRAAGWAGGEVHLWSRGDLEHATGMLLVERTGEQDLCGSMRQWYRSAFPGGSEVRRLPGEKMASEGSDQAASLRCAGNEARMVIESLRSPRKALRRWVPSPQRTVRGSTLTHSTPRAVTPRRSRTSTAPARSRTATVFVFSASAR